MFSGIVGTTAPVRSTSQKKACRIVRVQMPRGWKLKKGQSVSVDGICSTVVRSGRDFFEVEYMPETLSKTTAEFLDRGRSVNLERSLKLQDYVDGHLIYGHVDARIKVLALETQGSSVLVKIETPRHLRKYIVQQGAVAINGVSLTVVRIVRGSFAVALIPYTLEHTNLGDLKNGSLVNIEIDPLARYALAGKRAEGIVPRNAKRTARKGKNA